MYTAAVGKRNDGEQLLDACRRTLHSPRSIPYTGGVGHVGADKIQELVRRDAVTFRWRQTICNHSPHRADLPEVVVSAFYHTKDARCLR